VEPRLRCAKRSPLLEGQKCARKSPETQMPRYPRDRRGKGELLGHYLARLEQQRWSWEQSQPSGHWGNFLERLGKTYPWDWFCTFTFSNPSVTADGAHYWFRRYLARAEGLTKPYAFRADEYGGQNGRLHLHALVGNVDHLLRFCGERLSSNRWGTECCWLHRWPCGHARILPYDPGRGARFYIAKYVTKNLGDWELMGFDEGLVFKSEKEKPNGIHRGKST